MVRMAFFTTLTFSSFSSMLRLAMSFSSSSMSRLLVGGDTQMGGGHPKGWRSTSRMTRVLSTHVSSCPCPQAHGWGGDGAGCPQGHGAGARPPHSTPGCWAPSWAPPYQASSMKPTTNLRTSMDLSAWKAMISWGGTRGGQHQAGAFSTPPRSTSVPPRSTPSPSADPPHPPPSIHPNPPATDIQKVVQQRRVLVDDQLLHLGTDGRTNRQVRDAPGCPPPQTPPGAPRPPSPA